MQTVTLYSSSRHDFLAVAKQLGNVFLVAPKNGPWAVDINGDQNSGKSLIGFGIDCIFRPAHYPGDHIPADTSVDEALKPEVDKPVVYHNFGRVVDLSKERYDRRLQFFATTDARDARVMLCANIERTVGVKDYDLNAHGLDSDALDVAIRVAIIRQKYNLPDFVSRPLKNRFNETGAFWRKIGIYTPDNSPLNAQLQTIAEQNVRALELHL